MYDAAIWSNLPRVGTPFPKFFTNTTHHFYIYTYFYNLGMQQVNWRNLAFQANKTCFDKKKSHTVCYCFQEMLNRNLG